MTNTSTQTIFVPVRVEVASITSASGRVKASNADGGGNLTGAYWDYDTRVGTDNLLSPSETSAPRLMKFTNTSSEPFTVTFNVIGTLQRSSSSAGSGSSGGGGTSAPGTGGNNSNGTTTATNVVFSLSYNPVLNKVTLGLKK